MKQEPERPPTPTESSSVTSSAAPRAGKDPEVRENINTFLGIRDAFFNTNDESVKPPSGYQTEKDSELSNAGVSQQPSPRGSVTRGADGLSKKDKQEKSVDYDDIDPLGLNNDLRQISIALDNGEGDQVELEKHDVMNKTTSKEEESSEGSVMGGYRRKRMGWSDSD